MSLQKNESQTIRRGKCCAGTCNERRFGRPSICTKSTKFSQNTPTNLLEINNPTKSGKSNTSKINFYPGMCSIFADFLQNFSERQILWSLCSVAFHALALKFPIQTSLSVAPKLQVCVRSGEKCQNFRKTNTPPWRGGGHMWLRGECMAGACMDS